MNPPPSPRRGVGTARNATTPRSGRGRMGEQPSPQRSLRTAIHKRVLGAQRKPAQGIRLTMNWPGMPAVRLPNRAGVQGRSPWPSFESWRKPITTKFRPWRVETYIRFTNEQRAAAFERYLKTGSGREFSRRRFLPAYTRPAVEAPAGRLRPSKVWLARRSPQRGAKSGGSICQFEPPGVKPRSAARGGSAPLGRSAEREKWRWWEPIRTRGEQTRPLKGPRSTSSPLRGRVEVPGVEPGSEKLQA